MYSGPFCLKSELISDSETDDEFEKECSLDEIKIGVAKDGSFINVPASQVRDKGLHIPDFLDAETLDGKFDVTKAKDLEYSARLNYLRDKSCFLWESIRPCQSGKCCSNLR